MKKSPSRRVYSHVHATDNKSIYMASHVYRHFLTLMLILTLKLGHNPSTNLKPNPTRFINFALNKYQSPL